MSESSLSEVAQKALRKAGWYPGRSIDISKFEERLNSLGYEVFPVVQEFLREFGDLVVVQSIVAGGVRVTDRIYIKPLLEPLDLSTDDYWISKYRKVLGRPICLIAQWSHDTLMMDDAGNVYTGFDSLLQKLGNSGIDALEILLSGEPVDFYETWQLR